MLLINRECNGDMLLIDRKLAELEDDAEYTSFSKFIKLMKKSFNLIRTEKKKLHRPLSHSLTCFDEPIGRPCFCFTKGLIGLTNDLAMGEVKLRREKVAIGFSG